MIWRRVAIARVVLDALEQVHQLKHGLDLDVVVVFQAVLHVGEELRKKPVPRASRTTWEKATFLQIMPNWAQVLFYKMKKIWFGWFCLIKSGRHGLLLCGLIFLNSSSPVLCSYLGWEAKTLLYALYIGRSLECSQIGCMRELKLKLRELWYNINVSKINTSPFRSCAPQ